MNIYVTACNIVKVLYSIKKIYLTYLLYEIPVWIQNYIWYQIIFKTK